MRERRVITPYSVLKAQGNVVLPRLGSVTASPSVPPQTLGMEDVILSHSIEEEAVEVSKTI